jgi:Zn finger protein HypA/HybF involved in hydrogenase expression
MVYFRKVERAKSIIENGKELFLKECERCKAEFYGDKKATHCDNCRERKKT